MNIQQIYNKITSKSQNRKNFFHNTYIVKLISYNYKIFKIITKIIETKNSKKQRKLKREKNKFLLCHIRLC